MCLQFGMFEDIEVEFHELLDRAREMVDSDRSYCENVLAAMQLNQRRRSQAIEAVEHLLERVRVHWPEGESLREAIGIAGGEGDIAAVRAFECAFVALPSLRRPPPFTAAASPSPRDPRPARGPRRAGATTGRSRRARDSR
jgi:hypothetical protein